MDQTNDDLLIGEFLTEAQLIRADELDRAIDHALLQGLPIGRILVMQGRVTEKDLQSAVKVQSMVRDSIIPFQMAVKGLVTAAHEKIDVDIALAHLGWVDAGNLPTNKLGELLLESSILNTEQLSRALNNCRATGLPLGRILVSMGMIPSELLATALNAQLFVRAATITRQIAVHGLRSAEIRRSALEALLKQQGFINGILPKKVRLGQLLRTAGVIEEEVLWQALADVLRLEKALGEVLLAGKHINDNLLKIALKLQEMIANHTLTAAQGSQVLTKVNQQGQSLPLALAYLELPSCDFKTLVRFHELLMVSSFVNSQSLEMLAIEPDIPASSLDAFKTAELLLSHSVLNERLCYGALRCYFLVAICWLNLEQAVFALNQFKHRQISFDEVLQELKWAGKTHLFN